MKDVLYGVEIFIALALIVALMFQARGGGVSGIFGGWGTPTFRNRRGIEKTLFRLTIVLVVVFVIIAALTVGL